MAVRPGPLAGKGAIRGFAGDAPADAMKYLDEYRDARIARALASEIGQCTTRPWVLMEICGGQTHTIMRYGIDELLPRGLELVHGPGCPVCVTPLETIDKAIETCFAAGRDLGLLRRHVARARIALRSVSRQGSRRGRSHCLLSDRSGENCPFASQPQSGLSGHRF